VPQPLRGAGTTSWSYTAAMTFFVILDDVFHVRSDSAFFVQQQRLAGAHSKTLALSNLLAKSKISTI